MQKNLTLFLFCSVFALSSLAQTKYFKGELKGSNEVPANAATGFGVILAEYNTTTNQLELRGDYQGLSATITASHIHNAAAGVNGAVMYNITNTGLTSGSLSLSTTLTEQQETELMEGRVYANVHTSTFPGGELRTQLLPATVGKSRHLQCDLAGSSEVPPNASGATGTLYALLDKGENKLYVTGLFAGLSANSTAAHIHTAAAGSNGSVTFPLNVTTGLPAGVFSTVASVTPTQITDMEAGNTYCNVHTSNYPGGEIRGQLAVINDPQIVYLKGILQGSQEVPATPSAGKGVVLVQYDLGTNEFVMTGDYQSLSSLVTASHVHNAAAGINGGVIFNVTNTSLNFGNLIIVTTITDDQESELIAGNCYTNVHTVNYPGGEVRAQLTLTTAGQTKQFSGIFSGVNEVPPNASAGTGAINCLLDKGTHMLYVTSGFTGLGTSSTASHLHQAAVGINGPVLFPLDMAAGFTFGVASLATAVTTQNETDLESGMIYANIHSVNFPGGEIRTQLSLGNALPVKLISFNGYRNNEKVQLAWSVENQSDFRDFTIEQLTDRNNQWIQKGTVAANGLSGMQQYSFTDLPNLGSDVLLYRLKMTDVNGQRTYSSVVKINWKNGKAQLALLSNPVKTDQLHFQLTGIANMENASAYVMDMSGKILLRTNKLQAGTNGINIHTLSAGIYKLVVETNNGTIETSFMK